MASRDHKGTVLITGASSAIGAAYADRLAHRGYDMILVSRTHARLDLLATALSDATGQAVEIVVADLADAADLVRVETVLRTDASITMLVSNAGAGADVPLVAMPPETVKDMIALNVTAFTRLIFAALPGFVTREKGTLVNIGSMAAILPELCNGVYSATKAFVLTLTRSLHHDLADHGIRVQLVLTGADRNILNGQEKASIMADKVVDAALAGLDRGELVSIPALRGNEDWTNFEAACLALAAHSPRDKPT